MAETNFDIAQTVNFPTIDAGVGGWDADVNDGRVTLLDAILGGVTLLSRRVGITISSSGNGTALFTVPDGWNCIVHHVHFRDASASLSADDYQLGFNTPPSDWHSDLQMDSLTGTATQVLIASPEDWPFVSADRPPAGTIGLAGEVFRCLRQTGSSLSLTIDVLGSLYRV